VLVLAWTLGGGLGGLYLEHNPDKLGAVVGGAAAVDGEADFMTQVGQFFGGASETDAAIQASIEARPSAAERAADERDRIERENYGKPMEEAYGDSTEPGE
jgi:hypothetical protein